MVLSAAMLEQSLRRNTEENPYRAATLAHSWVEALANAIAKAMKTGRDDDGSWANKQFVIYVGADGVEVTVQGYMPGSVPELISDVKRATIPYVDNALVTVDPLRHPPGYGYGQGTEYLEILHSSAFRRIPSKLKMSGMMNESGLIEPNPMIALMSVHNAKESQRIGMYCVYCGKPLNQDEQQGVYLDYYHIRINASDPDISRVAYLCLECSGDRHFTEQFAVIDAMRRHRWLSLFPDGYPEDGRHARVSGISERAAS